MADRLRSAIEGQRVSGPVSSGQRELSGRARTRESTVNSRTQSWHVACSSACVLAPIAPHVCHVLWRELGHTDPLIDHPWPHADPQALVQDSIEVVVQVNGKLRSKVEVRASADKDEISAAALADATIQKWIEGKPVRKVIVPPGGKLVNVVV